MVVQVAGALGTVGEHRKALEQAERMEQEYVCLMTGQRSVDDSMTQSDVTEREGEEEGETRVRMCIHAYTRVRTCR